MMHCDALLHARLLRQTSIASAAARTASDAVSSPSAGDRILVAVGTVVPGMLSTHSGCFQNVLDRNCLAGKDSASACVYCLKLRAKAVVHN